MSVHKSTFWGPFFALVAFTICVGVYTWIDGIPERAAEMERVEREIKYRQIVDSIRAYGDSVRYAIYRAEFVKDSTDKVKQTRIAEQREHRRIVATRIATRNMNIEQCKMWAWSDTANFGNEEKAERDCIRRNNLLTN